MESIDRGAILVRRLPGWVGILWLSALPARFLMVFLCNEVLRQGASVRSHGTAMVALAQLVLAAWVVALIGRLFFVRACRIAHDSGDPSLAAVIRVPWRDLAAVLYAALLLEVLFWLVLPVWVLSPFVLLFCLAAAAVAPQRGFGPIAPLAALGDIEPWSLLRLGFALAIATIIVFFNAYGVVQGLFWALSGLAGIDLSHWKPLLRFDNPLFVLLLSAGVITLIEPFAVASIAVLAILSQARRTGDDLREWFAILRAQAKR